MSPERAEGRPLAVPGFARLAASYTLNELGDNFGAIALAILVLDETGSALAVAAVLVAAKVLPAFVAPLLTARLDRSRVARTLPALYVLEGLVFAALALLAGSFALPSVLALALIDGTLALTARALSRAAVATVLAPSGTLRRGNAILNVGFAVTSAVGPALGGLVTALGGAGFALALDAATFFAVALMLATARGLPVAAPEAEEPALTRLRAGLGYVRRHPRVRLLLAGEAAALVFFTLVIPIEVVYAKQTLDAGDTGYGLLLTAWGVGILIGSVLYPRLTHRSLGLLVGLSTAAVGAGYIGLAVSPTLGAACAASILGGAGNGVQWVAVMTAVQEAVAPAFQARVVGFLESLLAAMPGLGYLLGGVLAAVYSPRVAYAVAGVGVFAVLAVVVRGASRSGSSGPGVGSDAWDGQRFTRSSSSGQETPVRSP
jgi:MFS family permease